MAPNTEIGSTSCVHRPLVSEDLCTAITTPKLVATPYHPEMKSNKEAEAEPLGPYNPPDPAGFLTMTYPDDPSPTRESLGVGARWDVEANKRHEVWVGKAGCTYVIGE
ncbi:hypothetical protein LTR53_016532 [Teratosphaeriaceae sp. CCFEE 6253]|nr:hypothetical protein LTR53_016532 [Teratosphaeriaceae sp. CCFEE 6253]